MSMSKSSYPERPLGGRRPSRPGEARKKPSSEHVAGKRKGRVEVARAAMPRVVEGKGDSRVDLRLCSFGHMAAAGFLAKHRTFRVPLHEWNKKGRTASA